MEFMDARKTAIPLTNLHSVIGFHFIVTLALSSLPHSTGMLLLLSVLSILVLQSSTANSCMTVSKKDYFWQFINEF